MGRKPLLTKEQVLVAVQRWTAERGSTPSVENLRKELRVGSTRTVFRYLQMLQEDGAIERRPGAAGVKLLKPRSVGLGTRAIPLVGQVAAGSPMLADENIEGWLRIPQSFAMPVADRFFALHVRGNSMNRARVGKDLIEDGDLVLVRQKTNARPQDIVVALIDGEATVKRFVTRPGYCVLKPESKDPKYQPIPILVESDFRIMGTVTRVLKKGSPLMRDIFEERN
jgi:repressor LexA